MPELDPERRELLRRHVEKDGPSADLAQAILDITECDDSQ